MKQAHPVYQAADTPIRWLKDAVTLRTYLAQRDHFLSMYGRPAYAPHDQETSPAARGSVNHPVLP